MWQNYIIGAFRRLAKQKLFAAINIAGLAIGLAGCLSILLFVRDELSYDIFWPEADEVYHASWHTKPTGRPALWLGVTPGPLAPKLAAAFPEDIVVATRIMQSVPAIIKEGEATAAYTYYVDRNFFEIFRPTFLSGERSVAFRDTNGMVMTATAAMKYFGTTEILGREVLFDTGRSFIVSGVIEDLPETSQLDYEILVPLLDTDFVDDGHILTEDWDNIGFHTYFKLAPGVTKQRVEEQFGPFIDKNSPSNGPDFMASEVWRLELVSLRDVHLHGAGRAQIKPIGDMATIYSFSVIALLILMIACLNFMNLATAQSASRAREVAVRKVLGAGRGSIVHQFLTETAIMVLIAVILALTLVELTLPTLNELLRKMLQLDYSSDPLSMAALAGLALVTTIGAGLHPALVTSRYRPAKVLRTGKGEPAGSIKLRMILVVIQFAVSIFLISAAVLVYRQLDHVRSLDKGFNPDKVVWIRNIDHPSIKGSQDALKKRLLDHPDIVSAAYSWTLPGYGGRSYNSIDNVGGKEIPATTITSRYVDQDYFGTYEVAMVAGRNFATERSTDSVRGPDGWRDGATIVNQSALAYLGLGSADKAVGTTMTMDGNMLTIIGVVSDMMVDHSDTGFEPMIYVMDPEIFGRLGIRYRGDDKAIRDVIGGIWREMFPLVPLRMAYLNDTLDAQFAGDRERGNIFAIFSGLAVLISVLGLYGLASFSTAQRSKEIGVRKVMGATVVDIVRLLVWQFTKPVLVASVIAWPAVIFFLQEWMQQFPAQVGFGLLTFVGPSLLALGTAWLVVGGHALRVARANPVNALKCD